MKSWFVIPITKEEIAKIGLLSAFIIPVLAVIALWESMAEESLVILIFLMFPILFTFFFKEVFGWDWQIKIKLREEDDTD